jgi:hypothetical protein
MAERLGIARGDFDTCRAAMITYRDKFVAHLDDLEEMNIPVLTIAKDSTIFLYGHLQRNFMKRSLPRGAVFMDADKPQIIPNLAWATALSRERGGPIRCPFATVEACPRYYQSLALMGSAGSTKISDAEDKRLLKKWEKSDLWPRTDEQASSIFGPGDGVNIFSRFCPEVMFDQFGYFASGLSRYGDEIDSGLSHEQLAKQKASSEDPRWNWSSCTPMHYTECPVYAVLQNRMKKEIPGQDENTTAQDPGGMSSKFPCPTCRGETKQAVLAIINNEDWAFDGQVHFWHHYLIVKCAGCGTISFCHESMNSEEEDYDAQGRPLRIKTRKSYPEAPAPEEFFVNPKRLEEVRALPKTKYDTARLTEMLLELNICYARGAYLACMYLIRAIMDHVPPVFEQTNFMQVANNYGGGGRSFREAMANLESGSRKIADGYLHSHIRPTESLPSQTQVEFRALVDTLLAEVCRALKV